MGLSRGCVRDICAGCGRNLEYAKEIGGSSLYNPNGPDFDLCMDCYWSEERLIDDEQGEGNMQPALLEKYYQTFGEHRPKLYDVLKGEWV